MSSPHSPFAIRHSPLCELICIDPERVHQFWPCVEPLIARAMAHSSVSSLDGIACAVHAGRALLWIVWNGEEIKAAVVTELGTVDGKRLCTIAACGGRDSDEWLPLIADLEKYARAEGCKAMRIFGRRGWERLLPGYAARTMLEKELT
jgi:hypothetical protein